MAMLPASVDDAEVVAAIYIDSWNQCFRTPARDASTHPGKDGRSRTYIFRQMGIPAVLGVYTADAGSETGRGFYRPLISATAFSVGVVGLIEWWRPVPGCSCWRCSPSISRLVVRR